MVIAGIFVAFFYSMEILGAGFEASPRVIWAAANIVLIAVHAWITIKTGPQERWRRFVRFFAIAVAIVMSWRAVKYTAYAISVDSSSTAAIAYILLPGLYVCYAFKFYLQAWSAAFAVWALVAGNAYFRIVAVAIVTLFSSSIYNYERMQQQKNDQDDLILHLRRMDVREIHALVRDPTIQKQIWVLSAIACNGNTSSEDLHLIATLQDPALHTHMRPSEVSSACNPTGRAVMRLVAQHRNVTANTLEILSHSPEADVLSAVFDNARTPAAVVKRLDERVKIDPVMQSLCKRPFASDPCLLFSEKAHVARRLEKQGERDNGINSTGCAAGKREAHIGTKPDKKVAMCTSYWAPTSLTAPKSGFVCAHDGLCQSPADACANGWHLCGTGSTERARDLSIYLYRLCRTTMPNGMFVAAPGCLERKGCHEPSPNSVLCCGNECEGRTSVCGAYAPQACDSQEFAAFITSRSMKMRSDRVRGILCCKDGVIFPAWPSNQPSEYFKLKSYPKDK